MTNPSTMTDLDRLGAELARLEAVFETVPLAVAVFDGELQLSRANERFTELTALTPAQFPGRAIYDAFPNALADITEQIDDVATRGAGTVTIRMQFYHAIGPRTVEATLSRIDADDGIGGVLFVGADVTEREELREDLARSLGQLSTIFDVIPESVRVFDAGGDITRSNTQAQLDRSGHPPRSLTELWQHEHPRALNGTSLFMHEHPTARAMRGESVRGQTLRVRRRDGTPAVIEVNANPLRDSQGHIRGAISVERDVTERTRLATELEEQVRRSAVLFERVSTEAERLERMVAARTRQVVELEDARARERRLTAVGQLAAGVMHDINNALHPILAAAHLLHVNADNPDAVRDYAMRIAKAAETGATTAQRVGRFIRQDPLMGDCEETIDLVAIATEVVAMTRPLWAERARGGSIELQRVDDHTALARGIPGEIREALLNLIQNALDAMAGGGVLSIITSVRDAEACIEVRDTGVGMTAEVRDRAFEPFFSTKGTMGTGLGLSEVYGIMKRHRGDIDLESEPGAGSVIRLRFPLATAVAAAPPPPLRPRRSRHILLVEDNEESRALVEELLAAEGHSVDCVSTARDALTCLACGEGSPTYDLLLTDIGLPDANGWELVGEVRSRWPAMRIGVITGWEGRTSPAGSADFVLRKPVRTQDLLDQIAGDA